MGYILKNKRMEASVPLQRRIYHASYITKEIFSHVSLVENDIFLVSTNP